MVQFSKYGLLIKKKANLLIVLSIFIDILCSTQILSSKARKLLQKNVVYDHPESLIDSIDTQSCAVCKKIKIVKNFKIKDGTSQSISAN